MTHVVWSAQAWERLLEIEMFIAEDSPGAAVKLVDRLIERADNLARHADRGRRLPGMPGSGLRELIVRSCQRMADALSLIYHEDI